MPMPAILPYKRGGYRMNVTFGGQRSSIYGSTKEEVEKKYILKCYEYGMGVKVGQKTLVSDYFRTWLAIRQNDISPYTYETYRGNIENHIIPAHGNKYVQDLIPADIQQLLSAKKRERKAIGTEKDKYAAALKEKRDAQTDEERKAAEAKLAAINMGLVKKTPLGNTSLLYLYRIYHAAMEDAVKNKLILTNPVTPIAPPKKDKVKRVLPAEDEIKKLFDSVRGAEYELGVNIAVSCGLRRGELCALQWSDVIWDRCILIVDKAVVQTARVGMVTKPPKNDDPREVFIPSGLIALMKREQRKQAMNKECMGDAYFDSDYMIRHNDGTPFSPYSMSMCINRSIKQAGIKTTLHGLRSTYVSMGYKLGADEKAITDSAGHHSVEFNRARYQSVYEPMKKELADKLDTALYAEADGQDSPEEDGKQ